MNNNEEKGPIAAEENIEINDTGPKERKIIRKLSRRKTEESTEAMMLQTEEKILSAEEAEQAEEETAAETKVAGEDVTGSQEEAPIIKDITLDGEERDCPFCSRRIPVESEYCPYCGKPLIGNKAPSLLQNKKIIAAAAGALVLLLAVLLLTPVIKKSSSYKNAIKLMNEGSYNEAIEAFRSLEDYKDAETYVTYCRALDGYRSGDLNKSEELFRSLEDFEDSRRYAEYVSARKLIAYSTNADDYEKASEAFVNAEGLLDSEAMSLYCQGISLFLKEETSASDKLQEAIDSGGLDQDASNSAAAAIRFIKVKEKFDEDDYSCLDELKQIADGNDAMTSSMAQDLASYIEGRQYYDQEKYYSAYTCFNNCRSVKDAAELADSCFRDRPASGIIYKDTSSSVSVTIYDPSDGEDMFVKLYDSDDVLIESLYIRDGSSATARFQSGKVRMAIATGESDWWFGPEEAFGPMGTYERELLDGSNEYYNFPAGGSFTLKFNVSSGGNVGQKSSNYGDF